MNYTPGYTSNYNNGYRTFTTYGKNYSDTIMMLGRNYEWSDVVPEDHPDHESIKTNLKIQEMIRGREFTLEEARKWALQAHPDLMDWIPGQEEPEEIRDYSFEDIIPADHPAYTSVVEHIQWKESMIGRLMSRDEAQSYADTMLSAMKDETTPPVYTDQPSPEAIAAYEQGGIDFGKVLPYAAAGALALFLLNR